jgi:leader peptidase (prepilin peptidase)/N-methyltransferase
VRCYFLLVPFLHSAPPNLAINGVFVAAIGAVIGSFLNVVVHRVPREESVVRERSHCACGQSIRWYDLIPVISWFRLRGRARCCGQPISPRYPLVEAFTSVLFVTAWLALPSPFVLPAWVFVSCLLAISLIDAEHMDIPDGLSLGLAIAGIVFSIAIPQMHGIAGNPKAAAIVSGFYSLSGLLIGSSFLLWAGIMTSTVLKRDALGFGDVKLLGAIGAFCGWRGALFAIFGGAALGLATFIILAACGIKGRSLQDDDPEAAVFAGNTAVLPFGGAMPFGPMLASAGAIYFLAPHAWFDQLLPSF